MDKSKTDIFQEMALIFWKSLIFSGKGYTNNQLRQNTYTCKHTKSHFQDIILMFIKNYSYLFA